jgi:tetratricopeptide (TPR) repeat protein
MNLKDCCIGPTLGLTFVLLAAGCGRQDASAPLPQLSEEVVQLMEAVGRGELDDARGVLAKIDREKLPPPQRAMVDRVEAQLESVAGNYPVALQALERAIDSDALTGPEQLSARFDKGWTYAQMGQHAQAIAEYRAWQQDVPAPNNAQLLTMSESFAAGHDCATASSMIAKAHSRMTPEEKIDVAAALEIAQPLCPDEPGLRKYGDLLAGEGR